MKTKGIIYLIRINNYEVETDYIEVGRYYTMIRMPKDCWAALKMAEQKNVIAYRRGGYVWIQACTDIVTNINHVFAKSPEWIVRTYFPKREVLYSKEMQTDSALEQANLLNEGVLDADELEELKRKMDEA